jgi:hypothetical protein
MHLAHVPRHVRWRKSDVQPRSHALPVDLVHIVHPHRHPHTLVGRFVSVSSKRENIRSLAPASLPSQAKKNLAFTRPHRPKRRRRPPIPALLPAPLRKPRKASRNVRYIQDWSNVFRVHSAEAYHALSVLTCGRQIRQTLNANQSLFATYLNVCPKAVRSWEQGTRRPRQAALKLLEAIAQPSARRS